MTSSQVSSVRNFGVYSIDSCQWSFTSSPSTIVNSTHPRPKNNCESDHCSSPDQVGLLQFNIGWADAVVYRSTIALHRWPIVSTRDHVTPVSTSRVYDSRFTTTRYYLPISWRCLQNGLLPCVRSTQQKVYQKVYACSAPGSECF